jgi:hypothetical protein
MPNAPIPPKQEKKGLSPLAWVAIGCLGLLVLGGVVTTIIGVFVANKVGQYAQEMEDDPIAATAKLLAAANPEIELVSADKDSKTVTFRNVKTGEEISFNYDDIENGRVSFSADGEELQVQATGGEEGLVTIQSDEGTMTFGGGNAADIPEWVPVFPGATASGAYASEAGDQRSGAFSFESDSDLESILDFYEDEKDRAGLQVVSRTTSNDGALLVMGSPDQSRALNVMASRKGNSVEIAITFTEKR